MTNEEKKVALRRATYDVVSATIVEEGALSDDRFNALRLLISDYNSLDPIYEYFTPAKETITNG